MICTKRKIALYAHDGLGIGHTVRASIIAKALVVLNQQIEVTLISGSPVVNSFISEDIKLFSLPTYVQTTDDSTDIKDLKRQKKNTTNKRRQLLTSFFRNYKPNVLLVDHLPTGKREELDESIEYLHKIGTNIILGYRRISEDTESTFSIFNYEKHAYYLKNYYKEILIYSPPWIEDELGKLINTELPVSNVGFVCRKYRNSKSLARKQLNLPLNEKIICLNFGGGKNCAPLLKKVLDTWSKIEKPDAKLLLFEGFFMELEPEQIQSIRNSDNIIIQRGSASLPIGIAASDAVISTGGYNSLLEILYQKKPAWIIPNQAKESEQENSSLFLEKNGCLNTLEQNDKFQEKLATIFNYIIHKNFKNRTLKTIEDSHFDGDTNTATILIDLAMKNDLLEIEETEKFIKKKPLIALLTDEYPPQFGGVGRSVSRLVKNLSSNYQFIVVVLEEKSSTRKMRKKVVGNNIELHFARSINTPSQDDRVEMMMRIKHHLEGFQIDLFHCFFPSTTGMTCGLIAGMFNKPFIVSFRGNDIYKAVFTRHLQTIRWVMQNANELTFNNSEMAQLAQVTEPTKTPCHVFYNGIKPLKTIYYERYNEIANRKVYLGISGILRSKKGLDTLINACIELKNHDFDFKLLIIGDIKDSEKEYWLNLIKESHIEKYIEITGLVSLAKVENHLEKIDLFVFPSLYDGCPNSLLEAASMGLPIICSDIASTREILERDKECKMFIPENAQDLARKIIDLSKQPALLKEMGKNARTKIINKFSVSQEMEHWDSLYIKHIHTKTKTSK